MGTNILLITLCLIGFINIGRKMYCWLQGDYEEISTWSCVLGIWSASLLIAQYFE